MLYSLALSFEFLAKTLCSHIAIASATVLEQMIGFVAYIGTITKGDFLMQLAKYPIAALGTIAVISAATLVPQVKSDGYFPQPVLDAIRNVREERLDEIFTERAERINGRAAVRFDTERCTQ